MNWTSNRTTAVMLCGAFLILIASSVSAAMGGKRSGAYPDVAVPPEFTADGELILPKNFRRWVFIGAPLTPHGLNNEAAGFPEFHNVYVHPTAYDYYQRHGRFPEGTILVKELQLTQERSFPDGSRLEPSGRGYFPGTPNGIDIAVKDSKRYPDSNGWGFYNFGHHGPPYMATAPEAPVEACAACHMASAHEDMVFVGFYRAILTPLENDSMTSGKGAR